jgi:tripartite-type tricarboxylate transporter receptor subunit TctC
VEVRGKFPQWLPKALVGFTCLVWALAPLPARSQQFPSRPVTLVVSSQAGTAYDTIARILAPGLEKAAGQPIVVENKPGAGTYIGGAYVARATPDGYTVLLQAFGGLYTHLFVKDIPVKQSKELVPVAAISDLPFVLLTPADLPVKDLREFVAYVKANPGKLNVATFSGAAHSVELLDFLRTNGLKMQPIQFNTSAQVLTAMLRGEVHLNNGGPSAFREPVRAGKIKAIAITARERSSFFPDVPTTVEQGYDYVSSIFSAALVPSQTPPPVIGTLNDMFRRAMAMPDVREHLEKIQNPPAPYETPEQLSARLARDNERIERAVKEAGIVPG